MFVWILLVVAAVFGNANGAATRIVGGDLVSITEYPSMVQVDYRYTLWWSQACAGSVLTTQYVLSVAHCFTGFLFIIAQRRVRVGTSMRNSGGFVIGITRALNHDTYGSNDYEGDITILQLESRMNFGVGIAAVSLPEQGYEMPDGAPVIMVGWGETRVGGGGDKSSQLRATGVLSINHDECVNRYQQWSSGPAVTENMMCVGLLDVSEKDACEGDQGGPVFSNGTLVGVISWARSCANAYYPRVNTKVSAYVDWIKLKIEA